MKKELKVNRTAIVFVINHMHFGGCQKIVYDIINGASHLGNIYLIGNPGYYSSKLIENKKVIFIDRSRLSYLKLFFKLSELKNANSKLVLHTHNRRDITLRYFLRKCDTHIHTFHSAYINKNYLYRLVKPQKAISISKTVSNYLLKFNIKSELIYNGVNINGNDYFSSNEFDIATPRLLYVGRLSEEKGILKLLNAINEFNSNEHKLIRLDIIGDGVLLESCKELVLKNQKEHLEVNFLGYNTNPWSNIEQYDLLIIPSIFEGFCLVGVEAAVNGIPIIGSNILALREVLDFLPEKCFFYPEDIESINTAISFALNNRDEILKRVDLNRKSVTLKFSDSTMIKNYLDVFERYI